jgi:hypothetical protein
MEVSKDVHLFSRACEHLLASVAVHRPLTQEEVLLVKHYCNELLHKIVSPPTNPES